MGRDWTKDWPRRLDKGEKRDGIEDRAPGKRNIGGFRVIAAIQVQSFPNRLLFRKRSHWLVSIFVLCFKTLHLPFSLERTQRLNTDVTTS